MITVGAVYGGPEQQNSNIDLSICSLMQVTTDICGDFESGLFPAVNVVFYLPGSLTRPDWDGLRDGRFSRKDQMVMVQVAVPEGVVESDDPRPFLIDSLYGANAVAFEAFRVRGMNYPLAQAEEMVEKISEALSPPNE